MPWEHEPQASVSPASSVSPSSYTNTIFNQSARLLSQDCLLRYLNWSLPQWGVGMGGGGWGYSACKTNR